MMTAVYINSVNKEVDAEMTVNKVKFESIDNDYFNVLDYGAKGDGVTDDTEAIEKTIKAALSKNGTVYFPNGAYLINSTITIKKDDSKRLVFKGDSSSKLVGSATLEGHMFEVLLKYNFQVIDLSFEHKGSSGSAVYSVFLRAFNCVFESNEKNASPIVDFHGSDCKIDSCTFITNNVDAYSIYYSMLDKEISINDYIVDNTFKGKGKGIVVGDGLYTDSGRCEGLKINGNTFENTGESQIVIQEILHVDIANNTMKGSTGSAIVVANRGHGPDGIFINHNDIEADFSCIRTEGDSVYLSMIVVSDNVLNGGQYGFYDVTGANKCFVRDNEFNNQTKAAVKIQGASNLFIMDNFFNTNRNVLAYDLDGCEKTVVRNNRFTYKKQFRVNDMQILN